MAKWHYQQSRINSLFRLVIKGFDRRREIGLRNAFQDMSTEDLQTLKEFQIPIPDSSLQAKNALSTEFPEEREEDTAFSIIQKIQNHLQEIQV